MNGFSGSGRFCGFFLDLLFNGKPPVDLFLFVAGKELVKAVEGVPVIGVKAKFIDQDQCALLPVEGDHVPVLPFFGSFHQFADPFLDDPVVKFFDLRLENSFLHTGEVPEMGRVLVFKIGKCNLEQAGLDKKKTAGAQTDLKKNVNILLKK